MGVGIEEIEEGEVSVKEEDDVMECLTAEPSKLTSPVRTPTDKFQLLPAFLRVRGLVKQHLDSFNYLVNDEIKQIVRAQGNQRITAQNDENFYLKYLDVHVGQPSIDYEFRTRTITPQQCRLRDVTYSAPITVDIEYTRGKEIVTKRGRQGEGGAIPIGRIPIMLRSDRCLLTGKSEEELAKLGECPLDPGGYFVVKGAEKVILIQEQLAKNRLIIDEHSGDIKATIQSSTHERKTVTNVITKKEKLYIKISAFTEEINAAVVLRGMGLTSDQEIVQVVGQESAVVSYLVPTLNECKALGVFSSKQALEFIGSKMRTKMGFQGGRNAPQRRSKEEEARDALANLLLHHVPHNRYSFNRRVTYIGYILRRVIAAKLDPSLVDDRDYYGNKRLELAGALMSLLFEDLFKRLNAEVQKVADANLVKTQRTQFDVASVIRRDIITNGFEHALSSGHWSIKRFRMDRKGVTQVLSRLSFIAAVGMMTRVASNVEKSRKVAGPRSLQPSQWGMLCPADTPEGEACGLTKNLALLTHVTTDQDEMPLAKIAYLLGVEQAELIRGADLGTGNTVIVFLNGAILGVHGRPQIFIKNFRELRRRGRIGEFVNISLVQDRILISSDGGRVCRPLIICDKGVPRVKQKHLDALKDSQMDFPAFVREGLIEYLDVNEENNALVALYDHQCRKEITHVEIEPLTLLGVVAGLVPYPHHNQSPRNTYQCAMGKQAMGNIAFNQLNRMDTLLYLLVYPQRPLLTTKTIELCGFDRLGAGQNSTVAVMSYSGYDIEDAIVMNQASLDRAFGRCIVLRKYGTKVKRYINRTQDQIRGPPLEPKQVRSTHPKFKLVEMDGLPAVGERISAGQIFINKFVPLQTRETVPNPQAMPDEFYRQRPEIYKGAPGITGVVVDRVQLTENDDNPLNVKVMLRHVRRPELGDKFSSRHGQKGVVGNIVRQEDMAFNEYGICPDLIMNPHGFPSRMTVGKMIELIGSKAAVLKGKFNYGTAFGEPSGLATTVEEISETLVEHGFSYSGKDFITSGISGEPLECYIFMGSVYYQRLKHMVQDKMHARARGPRTVLTRQPTEGRSKDGGLRLGEMERDCLIAYGASMLLLERLMISSDKFEVHVDTRSGLLGYYSPARGCAVSPVDKSSEHMATISIPYACKLLFQELQGMNIIPRLKLGDM
ncbi:hypothetical protein BSKO_13489 [Bryopsis sp. KO-2023]|nr:hypothetical protein BSKO_13489 [Bryopsis sp. KO-2023]